MIRQGMDAVRHVLIGVEMELFVKFETFDTVDVICFNRPGLAL